LGNRKTKGKLRGLKRRVNIRLYFMKKRKKNVCSLFMNINRTFRKTLSKLNLKFSVDILHNKQLYPFIRYRARLKA
jgi:hypothetical protein